MPCQTARMGHSCQGMAFFVFFSVVFTAQDHPEGSIVSLLYRREFLINFFYRNMKKLDF